MYPLSREEELEQEVKRLRKRNEALKENIKEVNHDLEFHVIFTLISGTILIVIALLTFIYECINGETNWMTYHLSDILLPAFILWTSPFISYVLIMLKRNTRK